MRSCSAKMFSCGLVLSVCCVALAGCAGAASSSSGSSTTTSNTPHAATTIYVTNLPSGANATGQVLTFSATANGLVSPASTLTLPATFLPLNVAVDGAGQLYVQGYLQPATASSTSEILVYAAGASGSTAPLRTITPPAGVYQGGLSMVVDSAGDIYIASTQGVSPSQTGAIVELAAGASGAATPLRVIAGSNTGLGAAANVGIAVDALGNLYTAPYVSGAANNQILVFAPNATGNVAPTRTITVGATALPSGPLIESLAIDGSGNLYVPVLTGVGSLSTTLFVYGPAASGSATPLRTITGSATLLVEDTGITVDGVGNVYTAGYNASLAADALVFSPTATGNVAPTNAITSSAWVSSVQGSIAVY